MILVDTNVIIDFWKHPTDKAREIFLSENISICGIVQSELIHGARSENEINKIVSALNDFDFLELNDDDG